MKVLIIALALVVLAGTIVAERALRPADPGPAATAPPATAYPDAWVRGMCTAWRAVRGGPANPDEVGVLIAQTALTFVPSWAPGDKARSELTQFFRDIDRYRALEDDAPGTGADTLRQAEATLARARAALQDLELAIGQPLPCEIPAAPPLQRAPPQDTPVRP